MNTFPNQKVITIHTDMNKDNSKNSPYGCITRKAARIAARTLNDGTAAYIMYIHFALCQNSYTFALSPKNINNELGLTKKQYDLAVKKLKEAGYLHNIKGNKYIFSTIPSDNTTLQGIISPLESNDNTTLQGTNILTFKEEEIIQDTTNNTFILDDVIMDNNDEKVFPESKENLEHIDKIRQDYNIQYRNQLDTAQWNNQIEGMKIQAILNKYLSTHKENSLYKKIGDKYGRIIKGWNKEKQEPIICYSLFHLLPNMMKHNIDDIPQEYYTKN